MECKREGGLCRLLRRGLLRTEFLRRHCKYRAARNHYWVWRTRLSQHQQPRHSAGDLRLASDILKTKKVWSAAVIRPIFLPDSRSLVRSSRKSQKRAPQHGLLRPSLRIAVDFRHPTPCPLPQLERRNVRSTYEDSSFRGHAAYCNSDTNRPD